MFAEQNITWITTMSNTFQIVTNSQWQVLKKHTQKDGASQSLNGMSKRPRSIHSPKANFHTKNS